MVFFLSSFISSKILFLFLPLVFLALLPQPLVSSSQSLLILPLYSSFLILPLYPPRILRILLLSSPISFSSLSSFLSQILSLSLAIFLLHVYLSIYFQIFCPLFFSSIHLLIFLGYMILSNRSDLPSFLPSSFL